MLTHCRIEMHRLRKKNEMSNVKIRQVVTELRVESTHARKHARVHANLNIL